MREEIDGFEVVLGKHHYHFSYNESPFNNSCSARIAINKFYTNTLLESAGIPVPKAAYLNLEDFENNLLNERIADLNFPLVVKPLTGSLGMDVLCNIQSLEELTRHLLRIFSLHHHLLIEEFHGNLKSYRVLVFNKEVIGVVLCRPANVIGNGSLTIKELIDAANIERQALDNPDLGPITADEECMIRLKERGISLDYIPPKDERIVLAYTSNGTRGGSYESLGKEISRENRQLMIQVAEQLNLQLTGIDVECEDINQPIVETGGVIIEVNHRPDVRIHELPNAGHPQPVSKTIMRSFMYRHPFSYLRNLLF
ncbi:UDP-N-acetylmuramyl peptide synthase [Legionella quinlivanii]|uniref:UDP-N-acetylmuramyl peptide synthase n=1 Tax=Legionella quinlivanii TaxID=45073 RepID=A0A364LKT0_9GAMM|nr:UDP-N-acetylmuramyl peptide synthase [Legionella quinlivanii]RAP37035.1 UDP-N-acetylmuramyl peptide synthase [Legionella quinlivanii]